jgi:DNA-directed RNA polymerase subunit L
MFTNYQETGRSLLTSPAVMNTALFVLKDTNSTIANTLRRCILMETRSVSFRADLTDAEDPGVVIRKNTSVIFNEMLAHRLTLLPLGVVDIDGFDPTLYECDLKVKNERQGAVASDSLRHVTASDFTIRQKQPDNTYAELPPAAIDAMFPRDPTTGESSLLITLRPQWNPEQPFEEIDLTARPVIGRGRDFMGFSPVSQCSFANTPEDSAPRRDEFFAEWALAYKQIDNLGELPAEERDALRTEWETMAAQRCFKVGDDDQPNSFTFTVESVGIRPVRDIVAEGIQAMADLVAPYTDDTRPMTELGMSTQPVDSRMNGINILFQDQDHTLGNLLQTIITELYLDTEAPDSPITFAGYKIRHPLHRVMTLTLGFREGVPGDQATIARTVIAEAAREAQKRIAALATSWDMASGRVARGAAATGAAQEAVEG